MLIVAAQAVTTAASHAIVAEPGVISPLEASAKDSPSEGKGVGVAIVLAGVTESEQAGSPAGVKGVGAAAGAAEPE